jgi:hypothetical protein
MTHFEDFLQLGDEQLRINQVEEVDEGEEENGDHFIWQSPLSEEAGTLHNYLDGLLFMVIVILKIQ